MQAKKINLSSSRSKVCALFFVPFLSMQTLSTPAFSAGKAAERWYEIEVILFSQLDDKTLSNESFPDQEHQPTALPKYRRIVDLLTPHIYPDTSSLKLQLPQCGDYAKAKTLVELASIPPPYFTEKSLEQIKQTLFADDLTQESVFNDVDVNEEGLNEGTLTDNALSDNDLLTNTEDDNFSPADLTAEEFIPSLSQEQRELINQAEIEFTALQFNFSNQLPIDQICVLPAKFDQVFDGKFSVNLRGSIDGNEDLSSDKPYLISKDSLQMSDIVKKLKLSRNFRPLLHLGWRQAPKDRNKASAFRIFSGENLAFDYQKAQLDYQALTQQALIQQAELDEAQAKKALDEKLIDEESNFDINSDSITQPINTEQILQQRINDILANVDNISAANESQIVAQLNDDSLKIKLSADQASTLALQPTKPIEPIQPWSLDGLLRVHLNRYLYITADFNFLTSTPVDQKTSTELDQQPIFKSIRFNQNRRVISGEIHYFDHPYMGMIVQIRKYKRPEPDVDLKDAEVETTIN
ncbi:MAG: peptidoglycan binding protein CsiV [Colwellia sp.]|nr:peptidoglycan binding protein CsiV [Colwellia sp.]